jgi:hypothetical protein
MTDFALGDARPADLASIIARLRASGVTSLCGIAKALTALADTDCDWRVALRARNPGWQSARVQRRRCCGRTEIPSNNWKTM